MSDYYAKQAEDLAPVVKPLEWVKTYSNGNTYHAETLLGTWTVWEIDGRSFVRAPGDSGGRHVGETIGDAKLLAFSELSERILSALSLAPVTPQKAAEVLHVWLNSEMPNVRMVAAMFDGLRKTPGDDFDKMCAALKAIKEGE